MQCHNCNATLPDGVAFCKKCGAKQNLAAPIDSGVPTPPMGNGVPTPPPAQPHVPPQAPRPAEKAPRPARQEPRQERETRSAPPPRRGSNVGLMVTVAISATVLVAAVLAVGFMLATRADRVPSAPPEVAETVKPKAKPKQTAEPAPSDPPAAQPTVAPEALVPAVQPSAVVLLLDADSACDLVAAQYNCSARLLALEGYQYTIGCYAKNDEYRIGSVIVSGTDGTITPVSGDDPAAYNYLYEDYIFPSDTQYITYQDLAPLGREETNLMRNEIYARHGYIFNAQNLKDYFESKYWYVPTVPSADFNSAVLNEIETANLQTILDYEKSAGWRS